MFVTIKSEYDIKSFGFRVLASWRENADGPLRIVDPPIPVDESYPPEAIIAALRKVVDLIEADTCGEQGKA